MRAFFHACEVRRERPVLDGYLAHKKLPCPQEAIARGFGCSWDTYPESYITKYTSIRSKNLTGFFLSKNNCFPPVNVCRKR